MGMQLRTGRAPAIGVRKRHGATLRNECVIHHDGLTAGAFESDGEPVVDDLDVLAREQQPAELWRAVNALAADRRKRRQPVAVIDSTREEATSSPAIAAVDRHEVAGGIDD